jgi:1,4-dihydroxy-2-naphthoate octaprenyltransferase
MKLVAFLRLGRPKFLVGGFLLYALGAAIAGYHGHAIDLRRYLLGQLAVTAFQWMTHYANDYFDYDVDRANATPTQWSGGSRVLAAGELPRHIALDAARMLAAIGIAAATVIVMETGPASAIALGATLAIAWGYSAPPLRLCATGTGELATAIVVTGLVPWLGFHLQDPDHIGTRVVILALVPLGLLQFAMAIAVALPDAAGDRASGKRTLVVQLGRARAADLYAACTAAAFLWLPIAWQLGLPARAAQFAALPVPLAIWRISHLRADLQRGHFEPIARGAVVLLIATTIAMLAAFT